MPATRRRSAKDNRFSTSSTLRRKSAFCVTGNIYCGLHEFADMGFVLHFLRPGDLFVDVGANIAARQSG
jgi:hypothetical protein